MRAAAAAAHSPKDAPIARFKDVVFCRLRAISDRHGLRKIKACETMPSTVDQSIARLDGAA